MARMKLTNLGEFRQSVDLQSPSLVIREVEMQNVHLVHRHDINETLDVINRMKISSDVKMHSPPAVARCVVNGHGTDVCTARSVNNASERLHGVEHSHRVTCFKTNDVLIDA
ncbi:hypothetical protein DPMN_030152 [Dreissena polymorpha]|uniref:Uncharacterized protein n=1 Tax=Dreissena polymorpha TaxID=45954 RepID=A0A9D4M0K3_DREPO|nr:hypothetical protein DPMN_030152 [Dreissena polymorpha]